MRAKSIRYCLAVIFPFAIMLATGSIRAQETPGDQILDGIGETALVARYRLEENAKDTSRNQYHATFSGTTPSFADDARFGRALVLDATKREFLQLPAGALAGLDSLSVTGWMFLNKDAPWQRFFDFGVGPDRCFFSSPTGRDAEDGLRARITADGWANEQGPVSQRVAAGQWTHLAVVLDAAEKTLTTFVNGRQVGIASDIKWSLEDVLHQADSAANRLYFGKSQYESDATCDARLHDVRIYSIPLTASQVATISGNLPTSNETTDSENTAVPDRMDSSADSPDGRPILGREIVTVRELALQTPFGHLPRLPQYVDVTYLDGQPGPQVRAIWPAPRDNAQVLKAGTYVVTGIIPGTALKSRAVITVVPESAAPLPTPERHLEPFALGAVVLNQDSLGRDTPFMLNRDKFIDGLLASNPDDFLYMFRDAFGQTQPAEARPLDGWDNQTTRLRGHTTGHYLSAIAQAYASAAYDVELQARFKTKMDYLIATLYDLSQKSGKPASDGGPFQADPSTVPPGPGKSGFDSDLSAEGIRTDYWNWGVGFISAYPPDQFIMLEQGATYGGHNNQIWAPYYTLHKILAGLLDCYEVGGNEQALTVARDMSAWVYARLSRVPPATRVQMWNRYIAGEYGGMNEVLARLFRLTGDRQFLECAKLFDNTDFFFGNAQHQHGLAHNVDTIRGKHANQHIPQITGALETYRSTGEATYFQVADNFWHLCTGSYMYAIGGVAGASSPNNAECFTAEPDSLFKNGFSRDGQNETCATYNLLKLSRQLFMFQPDAQYMDYYEQALYNHILASVDEDNPGNTYHVPLNPGARKRFGNATLHEFTCCNGTALESGTKLQDSIYFHSTDNRQLFINLFIPSTLTWNDRAITLRQETAFPYSDRTKFVFERGGELEVHMRIPSWVGDDVKVWINGEEHAVRPVAGKYLAISRSWQTGDTIELQLPFRFHLSRVMDQPNIASIFYGPILLAVEESSQLATWRKVTLHASDLGATIHSDPARLRFQLGDLQLRPFFESYGRYSVYLDVTLGSSVPKGQR
jgi:DUF1680 family protein